MKKIILIICVLLVASNIYSQKSNKLTKTVLYSLENDEYVNYKEFKVDFNEVYPFTNNNSKDPNKFFAFVREKSTNNSNLVFCGERKTPDLREITIIKAGYRLEETTYITKNMDVNDKNYKKQTLYYKMNRWTYDSIVDVFEDGFIYKDKGSYYYRDYIINTFDNYAAPINFPVTIAEKIHMDNNSGTIKIGTKIYNTRLPYGYTYYLSSNGHFYFLYSDDLMQNSILVVDGFEYELNGKYEDIDFKFSYNGKHWMAVKNECFWIDGIMSSANNMIIKDFIITNNGNYGYVASEELKEGENDIVIVDGKPLAINVNVDYFTLNKYEQWAFKFQKKGNYYYSENKVITNITEEQDKYFYPKSYKDDEKCVLTSLNGKHTMEYKYNYNNVIIDGKEYITSPPFYAEWNKKTKSFVWNTVEGKDLVVYFFKVN